MWPAVGRGSTGEEGNLLKIGMNPQQKRWAHELRTNFPTCSTMFREMTRLKKYDPQCVNIELPNQRILSNFLSKLFVPKSNFVFKLLTSKLSEYCIDNLRRTEKASLNKACAYPAQLIQYVRTFEDVPKEEDAGYTLKYK